MADSVTFTISLIDKLTRPAKRMTEALAALKPVLDTMSDKAFTFKVPELKIPKLPKEPMGAMFGPGRKEQAAGLKFQEKETARIAKLAAQETKRAAQVELKEKRSLAAAATALDKQRSSALYRQVQQQERAQIKAVREVERAKLKQARQAERATQLKQSAIQDALANAPGARMVARVKELSAGFTALTGITPMAAAGIAAFGIAAAAAAVASLGLVVGIGALVFAGASLALSAAEAKGDTLDMLEAMLGSEQAAAATYGQLLGITKITSASKEQLTSAAQELAAAGVTSQRQLVDSVKAIAQVESVLKGGGSKIQGVVEKAAQTGKFEVNAKRLAGTGVQIAVLYEEISRRTGVGVKQVEAQLKAGKVSAEVGIDALTATIDKKFGGVAAKQALDFGVQMQRLKDNIGGLFADVKTGPFLDALNEIVSVFDSAMPAGAAMKEILTDAFNAVFRAVTAGAPYVRTFLKGLVIIGLQVAIALKPVIARLREAFGGDAKKGPLDLAKTMSLVGLAARRVTGALVAVMTAEPVWRLLGFTVDALLFTMKAVAGTLALVASPFIMVGLVILSTIRAIVALVSWLGSLASKATEVGSSLVSGLIEGIKLAAGSLYNVVSELATNALATFKKKFGIASPSKVMMGMGVNLSLGLAQGINAGAPAVNDNFREVITPPRATTQLGNGGARGASVVVQPGGIQVIVSATGIDDLREQMGEVMADVFERLALTQGTAA